MIESLNDCNLFRRRSEQAWKKNVDYWLSEPLRHVADVGAFITKQVAGLCLRKNMKVPVVVDMGFGSGWLLGSLLVNGPKFSYVGVDRNEAFVASAAKIFAATSPKAVFLLADLETDLALPVTADVFVNAFNFFELCDLAQAMRNVKNHLRPGGSLFMSTIDKSYLLLALSKHWEDFCNNLRLYQELPGIKYGFQPVDLGTRLSDVLEYPSVLYSTQDFVDAASAEGLRLVGYAEHAFTAAPVPKIYCHLEFERV